MLTNPMKGYGSRCRCCNKVLSNQTLSINPYTGEFDPLCNTCKSEIRKSNIFFYEDKMSLENSVWREKMGSMESSPCRDAEAVYQGFE